MHQCAVFWIRSYFARYCRRTRQRKAKHHYDSLLLPVTFLPKLVVIGSCVSKLYQVEGGNVFWDAVYLNRNYKYVLWNVQGICPTAESAMTDTVIFQCACNCRISTSVWNLSSTPIFHDFHVTRESRRFANIIGINWHRLIGPMLYAIAMRQITTMFSSDINIAYIYTWRCLLSVVVN